MTTIRSFIAIELSAEALAALTDLQNRLKPITPPHSVRWTAPTSIHLTLHFLGDVAAEDVTKITNLLQAAASACKPFLLTLSGLGCFPNTRRPRIIWAGVLGETNSLGRLHQDLGENLKTLGFTLDTRPYSPHLTLGRVKDGIQQRQLSQLGQALAQIQPQVGPLATLPVAEISLMRSELKSAGPVYTQLTAAALNLAA
jgi:RNA 2',3'-cyclic 3'-phosphodiesterase